MTRDLLHWSGIFVGVVVLVAWFKLWVWRVRRERGLP